MNVRWLSVDPGLTRTGVFYMEPGHFQSVTFEKERGEDRYHFMARLLHELVDRYGKKDPDVGIVEEYNYRMRGYMLAASVEAGGVVRAALAEMGVKHVAIAPSTWKSVNNFFMKKDTVDQEREYVVRGEQLAGEPFDSSDAVDAFLMWRAIQKILAGEVTSEAALHLKDKTEAIINGRELLR